MGERKTDGGSQEQKDFQRKNVAESPNQGSHAFATENIKETLRGLLLAKKFVTRTVGQGKDIVIVGISGDSPESLRYFQQANQLNFTLLSDPDGTVAKKYGVPVTEGIKSIKRTVAGEEVTLERSNTAARWTFIIPKGN